MPAKANFWARRQARRALVQALYQWQMTGGEISVVESQFSDGKTLAKADVAFFTELLRGVVRDPDAMDQVYAAHLDRAVKDLNHVERAVLRLGCFELLRRIDVPYRVVVSEYVELAKTFGAKDSYKYINGILDQVAKEQRTVEWGES